MAANKPSGSEVKPTLVARHSTDKSEENIAAELLNEALRVEAVVETPKNKEITKDQLGNLVGKVSDFYKTTNSVAFVGICATLQAGGSNKNKRSNVKITVGGCAFESKKINELIQQQLKITPRQLARLLAREIFTIAKKHKITGNAFVSLQRFYPHLLSGTTEDERYWSADFQIDNPICPEYIREALRQRYTDKFSSFPQKGR